MTDYGAWRAAMQDACDELLRDVGAPPADGRDP